MRSLKILPTIPSYSQTIWLQRQTKGSPSPDCAWCGPCSSAELAPYFERETLPGAEVHTDDELLDFARQRGNTGYHLVGTCRMGPAASRGTVVDDELRVHGVESLRVVDASIMPMLPSAIHSRRRSRLPKRAPTLFGDVARKRLPAREARSVDRGRPIWVAVLLPIVSRQSLAHRPRLPSVTAFPSMRTTSIIKPAVVSSLSSKCMNISLSIWVI